MFDSYTITVLLLLEELGPCGPGEAGEFVAAGETSPGGALPVTTYGRLLSHAHIGLRAGAFHITEAVRPLRGDADERQVSNTEIALVHGEGGIMSAHCTLLLGFRHQMDEM